MKSSRIITVATMLAVLALPLLGMGKEHGMHVKGSIAKLNQPAHTFSVKRKVGKDVNLSWNDATKAPKQPLQDGEAVVVTYIVKDGKNVATVIALAPVKPAPAKSKT